MLPEGIVGNMLRKHASPLPRAQEGAGAKRPRKKPKRRAAPWRRPSAAWWLSGSLPASSGMSSTASAIAPPTPSRSTTEIAAGDLHGTLLSRGKKAPVVLIVPGSGPTDRDGNNPLGVQAQPYKLLAEALFEDGIATVRIDKRGMFGSAGCRRSQRRDSRQYAEDYPRMDRRHPRRNGPQMCLPAWPFRRRADGLGRRPGTQGCLRPHPRFRRRAQAGRRAARAAESQPRQRPPPRPGPRRHRRTRSRPPRRYLGDAPRPDHRSSPRRCRIS